jgi:hypothetical protein
MTILNKVSNKSLMTGVTPIADVPDAPTVGTVTNSAFDGSVTVAVNAAATGGTPTSFIVTPSPTTSPATFTGSSPVTVTGLSDGVSYTFTAKGSNSTATGPSGSASSSFTEFVSGSYYSIATATIGAGGGSITFSSIPTTYTHLQIRLTGRSLYSAATDIVIFRFNSDSGNNYTLHRMYGDGSAASTQGAVPQTYGLAGDVPAATASSSLTTGASIIDILDYANTNKYKTARSLAGRDENGSGYSWFNSNLWLNTSAITSITIFGGNGNLAQYSQAALYGVN